MNVSRIGIAGWSIPREHRQLLTDQGSHLENQCRELCVTFGGVQRNGESGLPAHQICP
jgi:hypothetical protein